MAERQQALAINDPAAVVDMDLNCIGCGYNLRSLPLANACPECGTQVRRSTMGVELRYANPKWLHTVAVGVMLLAGMEICM